MKYLTCFYTLRPLKMVNFIFNLNGGTTKTTHLIITILPKDSSKYCTIYRSIFPFVTHIV